MAELWKSQLGKVWWLVLGDSLVFRPFAAASSIVTVNVPGTRSVGRFWRMFTRITIPGGL
jgi:hypothetical protein